jgi:hypothetical protein
MSDQQIDNITPPADAPLPWKKGKNYPKKLVDAKGGDIAQFYNHEYLNYAVAAANALPGLVQALKAVSLELHFCAEQLQAKGKNVSEGGSVKRALALSSAALAALPKEVRGG